MRELPEAVEAGERIEPSAEMRRQLFQLADVLLGLARSSRAVEPAAEFGDAIDEPHLGMAIEIGRERARRPVRPAAFCEAAQQLFRLDRIDLGDERDRVGGGLRLVQTPPQPLLEDGSEREVGLNAVENFRAGIDRRFHRIGAQQIVAKAVNGRACQLVQPCAGLLQRCALRLR